MAEVSNQRAAYFNGDILPESRMAPSLTALQERYPDVEIGSYRFNREGRFGARLVLRATEDARLAEAGTELEAALRELGGEFTWD